MHASIANPCTGQDAPPHMLIVRDPQRHAAAILARKFSLRPAVALIVAGSMNAGGQA
jgi:hypothetical protein